MHSGAILSERASKQALPCFSYHTKVQPGSVELEHTFQTEERLTL